MIYHKNQPHDYHRKEFDHAPQLVSQQKLVFECTSRARYKEIPCTAEGRSVASCNFNNGAIAPMNDLTKSHDGSMEKWYI